MNILDILVSSLSEISLAKPFDVLYQKAYKISLYYVEFNVYRLFCIDCVSVLKGNECNLFGS